MFRLRTALASLAVGTLTVAAVRPVLFQDMEMPKPTPMHDDIQKGVGEWEGTVTMFMPGMPSTPTPAKETVRSRGPFWTTSDFTSEFMGMPYEGHGCSGFDPAKNKFVSTWIDNTSSWLAVMEGAYDEKTKTIDMRWDAPDMTGKVVPHHADIVHGGDDAYTMTFFMGDTKTMVIDMKRKGAKAVGGSR